MFTGTFSAFINPDHKINLPEQFQALVSEGAVITQGFDMNLMVMPHQAFNELTERVMALNLTDPVTRNLLRKVLGNASEITLNNAGEISVPANLFQWIDFQSQSVVVGLGDFFEIWSEEAWTKQENIISSIDPDPKSYSSLSLCMP